MKKRSKQLSHHVKLVSPGGSPFVVGICPSGDRVAPERPRGAYGPPSIDIQSPSPGQIFYRGGPGNTVSICAQALVTGADNGTVKAAVVVDSNPNDDITCDNEMTADNREYMFAWNSLSLSAGSYFVRVSAASGSDTASQSVPIQVMDPPNYKSSRRG